MPLAAVDWTQVILAGIAAVVTVANGLGIVLVYSHLRTPSGKNIGTLVEDVQHTALANHYRIRSLTDDLGSRTPAAAVPDTEAAERSAEELHYGRRRTDG